MFHRLSLAIALSVLVSTPQVVLAEPITYAFNGTFKEPFDGSLTFSGTLTINATPTLGPGSGQLSVTENGSDVSLSLNLGGQAINFVNTPQNPYSNATFSAFVEWNGASAENPSGYPEVAFTAGGVSGGVGGNGSTLDFAMTIYSPSVSTLPANLASLSLPLDTSSFGITYFAEGATQITDTGGGVITSMEIVSTLEPNTLVVFAGLGIAALVLRRYRGS